jgi:toxin FitB
MIILDTNVVSETMRLTPSPMVLEWLSKHQDQLYSTSITVGEVFYGIELLPQGKRRNELLAGAERMFGIVLVGRIFPFGEQAAHVFAKVASARQAIGRPISELDAQIAAIAQVHGATLATRNTDDFAGCGIRLVNPWLE